MRQICKARSRMIVDLEKAYRLALSVKNCTAAIRAKELIGKLMGLFSESTNKSKGYSFQELSNEALETFIENSQQGVED